MGGYQLYEEAAEILPTENVATSGSGFPPRRRDRLPRE